MKSVLNIILFTFLLGTFLISCEKENIDEIILEDPDYEPEEEKVNSLLSQISTDNVQGSIMLNCVAIPYPFELELKSGKTKVINYKSDWDMAQDTSNMDKAVDFVFPLEIVDTEGKNVKIKSNLELGRDFASCIPQKGWAKAMSTNETLPACLYGGLFCFDLIYPVSLIDESGSITAINSETAMIDLFANTQSSLSFVLPIGVVNKDNGIQTTIENLDDFWSVIGQCKDMTPLVTSDGFVFQGFICFELVYPVTMVNGDGNTIMVNSADEYATLVLNGEPLEIVYPFGLKDDDGIITNVTNLTTYIQALNGCGEFEIIIETSETCDAPDHVLLFLNRGGPALSPCRFDINFPVKLLASGQMFTVNNMIEYFQVYNAFQLNEISVEFPVTVKVNQSGAVIKFDSKTELCKYIDDCD
jgi:hypothetical protein